MASEDKTKSSFINAVFILLIFPVDLDRTTQHIAFDGEKQRPPGLQAD